MGTFDPELIMTVWIKCVPCCAESESGCISREHNIDIEMSTVHNVTFIEL